MSVTKEIVRAAIERLRDDDFLFRRIRDRWISDKTFLEAIKTIGLIDSSLTFTTKELNQGLSNTKEWKTQYEFYDERNTCGLHRAKYGKNPGTFYT